MDNFFIVAIGSSAGGTVAYDELISHLPLNLNAAFIVIQHLHSDFRSENVRLLKAHTSMRVLQATHNQTIEKGCIYCIPEGVMMTLRNGRLRLVARQKVEIINYAIDIFLRSLANDAKERAIAILLSGYGRDGTLGVREIYNNGGIVMAQAPDSAQHSSIPDSIIASANPHFVLPPKELAETLVEIVKFQSLHN